MSPQVPINQKYNIVEKYLKLVQGKTKMIHYVQCTTPKIVDRITAPLFVEYKSESIKRKVSAY